MGGNQKSPAPYEEQVMEELIKEWGPKFRRLSRKYAIKGGRVEENYLYSEFLFLLLQAVGKVEPFTEDFDRYVNFSLRTKVANGMRSYLKRIRYTRKGLVRECLNCGLHTSHEKGDKVICPKCGAEGETGKNSRNLKWHVARYKIYSITSRTNVPATSGDPLNALIYKDLIQVVARRLRGFPDRQLFVYLLNPPKEVRDEVGRKPFIPYRVWADYLRVSTDTIRRAKTRICIELFRVSGDRKFLEPCPESLLRCEGL